MSEVVDRPGYRGNAQLIDEIVQRLVDVFHPERILLFGSRARGTADIESDIDLLVVADCDDPVHIRMARAQQALRGVPAAIDVFVSTPDEVKRYGTWLSHTIAVALREGTVLYESG